MNPGGAAKGDQVALKGPLLAGDEKQKIRIIDRTDFVVQFVWIPTLEKDRPSTDPRPPVTEEEAAASKKK